MVNIAMVILVDGHNCLFDDNFNPIDENYDLCPVSEEQSEGNGLISSSLLAAANKVSKSTLLLRNLWQCCR